MKGRVACEMGSNELMITELVLHNVFTELPPAEIAALLSCLVFEAKTETEPEIKESLKKVYVFMFFIIIANNQLCFSVSTSLWMLMSKSVMLKGNVMLLVKMMH